MPRFEFAGKSAIITGSSNGIGRAAAVLFMKEGANVTITGRSESALQDTNTLLLEAGANPQQILQIVGDLSDEVVQKQLIEETVKKFGKLDILVNNAGAAGPDNMGSMGFDQTPEQYDYIFNLNTRVFSPTMLTKLALPHLIKSKGEVVMVSSIAAMPFTMTSMPYYSMAKAALDQLTVNLAGTYMQQGVRVNCIRPGMIITKFMHKQGGTDDMQKELEKHFAQPKYVPAGRAGQAEEVAELIAFLSDRTKSGYIVGQNIVIDGGATLLCAMSSAYADANLPK